MKAFIPGFLLLAFVAMSSQQGVMSPATIAGRTQIVKKNYEWLLKLENAYLDVYAEFQKAYTKIYAPYKPLYNEFNVAYADFPLNKLSPETAATFIKLCDQMNSTLFFLGDKAAMINLQVNFMIMMYSESIGPAYALKTSFTMSMQSLFMYVAIRSYDRPIAEACITKMLSGYVPAYEPMAQSFLQMGYDITATIPALKSNASFAINCAVADGRALSKKMKSCGKNSLTNECTDQIVQQYAIGSDPTQYPIIKALNKPYSDLVTATSYISATYSSMMMLSRNDIENLERKVEALKSIC